MLYDTEDVKEAAAEFAVIFGTRQEQLIKDRVEAAREAKEDAKILEDEEPIRRALSKMTLLELIEANLDLQDEIECATDNDARGELYDQSKETKDLMIRKLNGYGKALLNIQAEKASINDEIKRLQGLKKSREATIKSMLDTMQLALDSIGEKKLKTTHCELTISVGTGALEVFDEAEVPERFWNEKTTRVIDKDAVKEFIIESEAIGEEVGFATIVKSRQLKIK